jgi:hypothetical protein
MIFDNGWVHASISGILLTFLGFFRKLKFIIKEISTQYTSNISRIEVPQILDFQSERRATNKKLDTLIKLDILIIVLAILGMVIIYLLSKDTHDQSNA